MNLMKNTETSSFQMDDFIVSMINGFAQIMSAPTWAIDSIGKRYVNLESAKTQLRLLIDMREINEHELKIKDELLSIGIIPS